MESSKCFSHSFLFFCIFSKYLVAPVPWKYKGNEIDFFEILGYAQLNKGCPLPRNHLEKQTPFSACATIMQNVLIL